MEQTDKTWCTWQKSNKRVPQIFKLRIDKKLTHGGLTPETESPSMHRLHVAAKNTAEINVERVRHQQTSVMTT